jgi:hypothetical protein
MARDRSYSDRHAFPNPHHKAIKGISLREYVATHVMQGLVAHEGMGSGSIPEEIADTAMKLTEALLLKLDKAQADLLD